MWTYMNLYRFVGIYLNWKNLTGSRWQCGTANGGKVVVRILVREQCAQQGAAVLLVVKRCQAHCCTPPRALLQTAANCRTAARYCAHCHTLPSALPHTTKRTAAHNQAHCHILSHTAAHGRVHTAAHNPAAALPHTAARLHNAAHCCNCCLFNNQIL
jgi:hypothetical protein